MLGENRTGSIGLPFPDVDCRIVSLDDGVTVLETGEIGELVIKGPQVMKGYHNMPTETMNALREGWLYTGDIARMDEDGYFISSTERRSRSSRAATRSGRARWKR
jgi:long-chain acyl-CoA synthetase